MNKELPTSGIDFHRVVGGDTKKYESLQCFMCLSLCVQPLYLNCCEQLVCKICLENWTAFKNECPHCKKESPLANVPNRFILRIFDDIEVACRFTEAGCKDKPKYPFLSSHEENCLYNQNRSVECISCKKMIKVNESAGHNCVQHLMEIIQIQNTKIGDLEELTQHIMKKMSEMDFSQTNPRERRELFSTKVHTHRLKYTMRNSGYHCNLKCDKRFSIQSTSLCCIECNFDACEECVDLAMRCYDRNSELHLHILVPSYRQEGMVKCDSCSIQLFGASNTWACRACDFDACFDCYWGLKSKASNSSTAFSQLLSRKKK